MADTRPITRLTIVDKETGAETETDIQTCARGVTCDEGKTAQDHISDFVAHKKDVNRHVLVQIGGDEPATGPALWFNTAAAPTQIMMLDLDNNGDDDTVRATVDGKTYGVDNATVDTPVTKSGTYNFDII